MASFFPFLGMAQARRNNSDSREKTPETPSLPLPQSNFQSAIKIEWGTWRLEG